MKILCTGSDGMTSASLIPYLQSQDHDVYPTDIAELDVRNRDDIAKGIHDTNADIVCHLAAITSLEECEDDPDNAYLTNALGTKYVAQECRLSNIPMAYISSAGIFDGEQDINQPYTEFDTPAPINVYGASKYAGEKFVRMWCPQSYVVRCGWMLGGGPHKDKKFAHHMMSQIESGCDTLLAVVDKFGSPTYAPDMVKCFESLITSGDYGTFHMVSPGKCSRYDMARAILDILGRDDIALKPASSAFFASTFHAPRPTSEVMRNYVLDLQSRNSMRPWREALAEYLQEWV